MFSPAKKSVKPMKHRSARFIPEMRALQNDSTDVCIS
jgi:hypothetical protein